MDRKPLVSIIIPIYNGEHWINDCFEAILKQEILQSENIQLSVYNDASTDGTSRLLSDWKKKISSVQNLSIIVSEGKNVPQGVGFAKNQAVKQSSGEYLCFQDIDDVMLPRRISAQLAEAEKYPDAANESVMNKWKATEKELGEKLRKLNRDPSFNKLLAYLKEVETPQIFVVVCHRKEYEQNYFYCSEIIGCQVKRIPENSTPRFVSWANDLPQNLLTVQIYTSHGPTVLMPTWFFHKRVYEKAGEFSEGGKGVPEDLLFFYSHLDGGGTVRRVDEVLLIYRYHADCTTLSVAEETIWDIRLNHLEQWVLPKWAAFTIWNAGKQGRRFYRSLKPSNRAKVTHFCDVDHKKIGKFYEPYFKPGAGERVKIPIVHFTKARPPFITCVKLDLTEGQFERNLNSLSLIEGTDFIVFS